MHIQTLGTRGLAWSISSASKSGDYPRSPHFKQPARVVSGGSSSPALNLFTLNGDMNYIHLFLAYVAIAIISKIITNIFISLEKKTK